VCRDYRRAGVRGRGDSRSRRRRRTMLDGSGVMLSRRARFRCVQLTEMMRVGGTRICLAGSRVKLIK